MAVKDVIQNYSINQNWNKIKYIARFSDLILNGIAFENKNKNHYLYHF